jgi:hypothetical protein
MALYLGKNKIVINSNGAVYTLNIASIHQLFNGVKLISLDKMILKSSDGLYLTAKVGDQ